MNGTLYDAELHIVHKRVTDNSAEEILGVVGIFFDRKTGGLEHNDFLQSLRAYEFRKVVTLMNQTFPADDVPLMKLTQNVNTERFWNYKGGLTTPPCDETVEWVVFSDVQTISQ